MRIQNLKGIHTKKRPYELQIDQAVDVNNMLVNEKGSISTRKGYSKYSSSAYSGAITGIYDYKKAYYAYNSNPYAHADSTFGNHFIITHNDTAPDPDDSDVEDIINDIEDQIPIIDDDGDELILSSVEGNYTQIQYYGGKIYILYHNAGSNLRLMSATPTGSGFSDVLVNTGLVPPFNDGAGVGWHFIKNKARFVIHSDKVHYVYLKNDGTYDQIYTAISDLDGSGFAETKRTTGAYNCESPNIIACATYIHFAWERFAQKEIGLARTAHDGTGYSETTPALSLNRGNFTPKLIVNGSTLYMFYYDETAWGAPYHSDLYGPHHSSMALDHTGLSYTALNCWNMYLPENDPDTSIHPPVKVDIDGSTIYYYIYSNYGHMWLCTSALDGTGFSIQAPEMVYDYNGINDSAFKVGNTNVHYIRAFSSVLPFYQLRTAVSAKAGTGWSETTWFTIEPTVFLTNALGVDMTRTGNICYCSYANADGYITVGLIDAA